MTVDFKISSPLPIVAFGGLSGRVDQSFSLINQLFKAFPRELYLLSSQNISFLLHPGSNRIYVPKRLVGVPCGIIPIAGPTTITLQDFRWNLGGDSECPFHLIVENFVTKFGGVISTSNEIHGESAVVITDKPVLWTIELDRSMSWSQRDQNVLEEARNSKTSLISSLGYKIHSKIQGA